MAVIAQYLPLSKRLNLNLVNKDFYNKIVPQIFETNHDYPPVEKKYIFYLKDQVVWGLQVGAQTTTREIEFEYDLWLHDHHHEFLSVDGSAGNRLIKLFSAKEINSAATEDSMKI